LTEQRIGLGLPSLRPETLSLSILEAISSARKSGLTLAPEAGTERLRAASGKQISDLEIFDSVETALEGGWQAFKLYFMIGMPTETVEDIDGIVGILRHIAYLARQKKGRCNVNVAISPFNPKTHTPWQWEKQVDITELKRKIDRIIAGVRKPNINIKYRDLDLSSIEGVIGRGDRRLGKVILTAYHKGSRLDGWSEWFVPQRWYDAFAESGIDMAFYSNAIDLEAPLPWDHIEKGISKEFLKRENLQSKEGIPPKTAFDRKKSIQLRTQAEAGFGRKPKRIVKQTTVPGTYKIRVRYTRGTLVRYLSHLDIIRTLYRALRRGEIPVAYSEGYHPHIKISFGPPLPLGYISDAEYFDLQLSQPYREEFIIKLMASLPPGLSISGYKSYFANVSSLTKQLNLARYEIPFIDGIKYDPETIACIASEKSLRVKRNRNGEETEVEAGQFIDNLSVGENGIILDVEQTPDGLIKPEEILTFGLNIDIRLVKPLAIKRLSQYFKSGQRLIEPLDLV
jgi:radical SAM-linked protein